MKRFHWFHYAAAGIVGLGLVLPTSAMAAPSGPAPTPAGKVTTPAPTPGKPTTPAISDVSLGAGGSLNGQVVDSKGAPVAQTTVTIHTAGTQVASAVTDAQGNFSVIGVKGGVIEANAGSSCTVLRAWTPDACPPSADKSKCTIPCQPIIRGQSPGGEGFHWPTGKLGSCPPYYPGPPCGPICCRHPSS